MAASAEFWLVVGIGLLLWGGLAAILFWGGPHWFRRQFARRQRQLDEHEEFLSTLITKSEATYADLKAQVEIYRAENARKDERIALLISELAQVKRELAQVKQQLEERRVIEVKPAPKALSILAIWPAAPDLPALDTDAEADAFYNAGYAYSALRGIRANRAGVILELDRIKPTVIQIGGHGNSDGILLSDGIAEPGFWGELVRGKNIELMVLLSCDSGQQDELNISDALIRAGVKAVISCDGSISDVDAVRFAQLLYNKLSDGLSLQQAVQRSKLAVSRKAAEMIRLREK